MTKRLLLLLPLLALSCGDAATTPDPGPPSAVARFAPSESAPLDWGDVPFPSELYRDATGTIRVGAVPTAMSDAPLFAALRDVFAARDGFCATCNAYFVLDGELDGATIPRAVPEPASDDALLLADVDPASPERGRLFPLRVEWNAASGVVALRPARGVALHGGRRYAAALTSRIRASDGTPLGASEAFRRVRDGDAADDATLARVRAVLEPALAELEAAGVERSSVVALAPFTTEDVTADVLAARRVAREGPALVATIDRRWSGDELDALLGVPSVDRPGIDVPPAPGSEGTRSIGHATIEEVLAGSFSAARVVDGAGTDIGTVRRDASGAISAGPRETVLSS